MNPHLIWKEDLCITCDIKNALTSKFSIFDVKEEPKAYFVTTIAICKGSPNAFALCKHNSFLFDPFLDGPPLKYSLYKELSLKDHTYSSKVAMYT